MDEAIFQGKLQRLVAGYSLAWMLAANLVGVFLSVLLLWPEWGAWLGPLTYGRWLPLHMDWHLYGWCALPIVGLLLRYLLPVGRTCLTEAHVALGLWSAALLLMGVMALAGESSGKLFLEWKSASRVAFPAAQIFLWSLLAMHFVRRVQRAGRFARADGLRAVILLLLLASPVAIFVTSGVEVAPPINPESGGATGHSLLASSLGILVLFGLMPFMLRVRRRPEATPVGRLYVAAMAGSFCVWWLLDHGNASNRWPGQIAGLAVLVLWIPLVAAYFRAHEWGAEARLWAMAFVAWWGLLTVNGFVTFLPPVLELAKFTNAMVAHAHLAMAGMMTAFNALILVSLGPSREGSPWADVPAFAMWHLGTFAYVLVMTVQGIREGMDPLILSGSDPVTAFLYLIRLLAGLSMTGAALRWIYMNGRL